MTHAQPWSTGWAGAWIASSNPIPLDELFLERTSHIMEAILIKSRRCVAHLYYTLNTELDSVDLVVKPSTTAEDTGSLPVLPLSRGQTQKVDSYVVSCFIFF